MNESVPLQDIVDKYRQQFDEATYQLLCHKILVEQKNEEIASLRQRLADATDKQLDELD